MTKRKWMTLSVACVAAASIAGGCAAKKKDNGKISLDRGVTDVNATKAATPPDPSYVSIPAAALQPRFVPVDAPAVVPAYASAQSPAVDPSTMLSAAPAGPAPAITQTPSVVPSAPAGAARQYRVQKGDTLFRIAHVHYGNGNRWQQIASANPGLTPAALRAGSTIVVP